MSLAHIVKPEAKLNALVGFYISVNLPIYSRHGILSYIRFPKRQAGVTSRRASCATEGLEHVLYDNTQTSHLLNFPLQADPNSRIRITLML